MSVRRAHGKAARTRGRYRARTLQDRHRQLTQDGREIPVFPVTVTRFDPEAKRDEAK